MKIKVNWEGVIIFGAIVVFLIFNYVLVSWTSFTDEILIMKKWGDLVLEKGIFDVYRSGASDYPPIYLLILAFNSWVVRNFWIDPLVMAKTIPILMILFTGLMIYRYLRSEGQKKSWVVFILYIFNLSLLYNSSYWGQVDSVHSFFMVMSVIFLLKKRYLSSSLIMLVAALTKVMSFSLMPILWVIILMKSGWQKSIRWFSINVWLLFLILLPFWLTGGGENFLYNLFPLGLSSFVSLNAFNFWFCLFPGFYPELMVSDSLGWGVVSFRIMGLVMLGFYIVLVIYSLRKKIDKEKIILAISSIALAFFMLPTEIHERYLFSFFPLLALLCLKRKRYLYFYLFFSLTYLINMMMVMAFWGNFWPFIQIQTWVNGMVDKYSFAQFGRVIAIINMVNFIYFSKVGILKNDD